MRTESILSICIPTYNRASFLDVIIPNLIIIAEKYNIQIYISDNCSNDNTKEIVSKYVSKNSILTYFRHETNIGPDDNFEYVLKMPKTKYRWLLADASFVDDDHIDFLIHDLQNADYDAYILNAENYRSCYLPKDDIVFNNPEDVLKKIGWHLTWISCSIYNKSLIESLDFRRYKNSSFNQMAILFDPLAGKDCLVKFSPNIIVKALPVPKTSAWQFNVYNVFYRQWYLFIMALPLSYSYEAKKKCIEDHSKYAHVLHLLFHTRRKLERKWTINDVIKNRFFIKQTKTNYWFLFIVGLMPRSINHVIYFSLRVIHKIRKILRGY